ncbi:hypothetical protein GCM10018771_64800 [Streptomyces cellulosae]|jgi:hypothetical protein|nr:hypothetical protein GCM10018771_64800 [Streptomyces cellulosae]
MPPTLMPTSGGCLLYACGESWDAIRVPRSVGLTAVGNLGPRCGAVAEDPAGLVVYFFTRCGTALTWCVENTRGLGPGATVTIPPRRRTSGPGPHWRICPGDAGWLTDADALHAALLDAFGKPSEIGLTTAPLAEPAITS